MRPETVERDIAAPARLRGANVHVLEDFNEGSAGMSRRYRALPADHPLVKAWVKRKIDEVQFNAGNKYRVLHEKAYDPRGIDSTQLMAIDRSVGSGLPMLRGGDMQAQISLKLIDRRLTPVNRGIIRNFCGLGVPMGSSVQSVIDFHPTGYLSRLREALDDLVVVFRKISVPDLERDIEREIA